MSFPYYTGKPENQNKSAPVDLPVSRREGLEKPSGYLAEPGLVDAVNVAILLGQPLLLTGEPGTGKTQLAASVAAELGLDAPLKFETKSSSVSRDLFYTFDTVGRFHAAQTQGKGEALDFITYNALGKAILYAMPDQAARPYLPAGTQHSASRRSVVLIDEVDKAPRDFPNDILNEIEGMYFRVPELGNAEINADAAMRPIVIITSNSEKSLPDAFLRRCVFHHIQFPDRTRLEEIVNMRVGGYVAGNSDFLDDALSLFDALRQRESGLRKRPATAELLGWIIALKEMAGNAENPVRAGADRLKSSLSALIKNAEDLPQATAVVDRWLAE